MQDAYGDVSKIDLWIGGLAESALTEQGSQLGELFQAILVKQFVELRDGDRFWYENYLSNDELDRVRNVTLAAVIRNNTDIGNELQDNVFLLTGKQNCATRWHQINVLAAELPIRDKPIFKRMKWI